jgi:hypothetical protein
LKEAKDVYVQQRGSFSTQKKKNQKRSDGNSSLPRVIEKEQIICFVGDGLKPSKHRVEYMERYIRKYGLIASILMDERGEIIDGLDLISPGHAL